MEEELRKAKDRIAKLEACLIFVTKLAYSTVNDARYLAEEIATDLNAAIVTMNEAKMDAFLPPCLDCRKLPNGTVDTLIETLKRGERECIERMLEAMK